MSLPRSSFYANPERAEEDPVVVEIKTIAETCRGYGYPLPRQTMRSIGERGRVTAELRNRGQIVNSKKVRRIMRENALNPRRKRRYVVTTDSDHDSPIYPNVARGYEVHGPDQLWPFSDPSDRLSAERLATSPTSPSPPGSPTSLSSWIPGRARSWATRWVAPSRPV